MIQKKSTRRLFGLISTALVASIMMQWLIIPRFSWNGVLAEGEDPLPPQMDSASAYNYSRVLSYGSDYGIIANTLNKHSHMETTYAAKVFDGMDNSDIDFITNPAHFMVGALTEGSELAFGRNTLADGSGYCDEFIIEAPQSVLDSIRFMEGFRRNDTTVHRVERTQDQINSSIDALMLNARTYATTFNNRAISPNYVFPSDCVFNGTTPTTNSYIHLTEGNMFINLTDVYADKVVYINVDETMILAIAKNNGVQITKPDSTVVVFNFPDGVSLSGEARTQAYDCDIFINQITVNDTISKTAANGGSSSADNPFTDVDSVVCRSIIWNVPGTRTICLGDMGGVLNAPDSAVQSREGSTNGWIIANTMDVYVEHHFIYQDTSSASMGDFSFYIVKALTRQYGYNADYSGDASHSVVVPDTSISISAGQFAFIWQEYTDNTYQTTVGDSTRAPVGTLSSAPANAYFPHITFFSDEGHTADNHYVAPGTTRHFYFRVTEDPNTGVEGISNSAGYVDIRLDVTAGNDGTFTYVVDYTFWTGDSNDLFIYNAEHVDNVTGHEFRIGSFYNRVDYDVEYGSLTIGKIVTLDESSYEQSSHPFAGIGPGFTFTVTREINGTTYYYDKDGNRSTSPLYVTVSGDEINYHWNGQGSITINNLPVGTYTITEVIDSTVSEITTTGGTTYYLDATDYSVAGASTQTVTVSTNTQSDISVTNDYTTTPQYTGSLVITKQIALPAGGSLSDLGDIVFTISPAINGVSTLTLDPDNIAGTGWLYDDTTGIFTYTFDSLVQGTEYTVTETEDGTNTTNNYDVVVVTPAPVTIPTDSTQNTSVTAAVTNEYSEGQTPAPATITITKTITLDGVGLDELGNIVFTIDPAIGIVDALTLDPDNYSSAGWQRTGSGTSTNPYVYTYTFNNVDNDTYTITESSNGVPTGSQITCVTTPASGTNTATISDTERTAAARFDNTYTGATTYTGSLVIRKTITGATLDQLGTITFTAVGTGSTSGSLSIPDLTSVNVGTVVGTNWIDEGNGVYTFTVSGLDQGATYLVTETADGSNASYDVTVTPVSEEVNVTIPTSTTADTSVNAEFANAYTATTPTYGYIKVVKTLSGIPLDLVGDINFTVSGVSGITIPTLNSTSVADGTWASSGSTYTYVIPTAIAVGTEVTITEADPTSPIVDGNTTYTIIATPSPVTITVTEVAQDAALPAAFTNTYNSTTTTYTGSLVIRKTITGATLDQLGTITFTAVGTGSTSGSLSIPDLTSANVGTVVGTNWIDEGNGVYTFTVSGLDQGATYLVTETEDGSNASYDVTVTPVSEEVNVTIPTSTTADTSVNAEFANAYTATTPVEGSIEIRKTITLTSGVLLSEIGTITFEVRNGRTVVRTISLDPNNLGTGWTKNGDVYSYTVTGLEAGTEYTVYETATGEQATVVLTAGTDRDEKTVTASAVNPLPDTAIAGFANAYTRAGTITVTKRVDGATASGETYYVVLRSADNPSATSYTYYALNGDVVATPRGAVQSITAGATVTYTRLRLDIAYEVVETDVYGELISSSNPPAAISGYDWTSTGSTISVPVPLSATEYARTAEIVNNYVVSTGASVNINKVVSTTGNPLSGAILEITRTDDTSYEFDISQFTPGQGAGSASVSGNTLRFTTGSEQSTITGLPDGTYKLSEISAPQGYDTASDMVFVVVNGHLSEIDDYPVTGSTVTMRDSLTQTGSLTIEKVQATGSDTIPADAEFTITVTFGQAVNYSVNGAAAITTASDTYVATLKVGESVTLSNIPVGVTYTVVETAPGTGYGTPTYTNGSGTITSGTTTATVANTYTQQTGSLTVRKTQATGSDTIPADAEFTIAVTFGQAVNYSVNGAAAITTASDTYVATLKVGESVTLSNIPVGVTYTVVETAPGTGYGTPTYTNETGSITAAGITATVANTYTAPAVTGSLKINKTVDGLGSDTLDALTNFEFTVTWVDTSVTPNVTYYYYLENGTTKVSRDEHTVVVSIAAGQVSGSVQLDGLIAGRAYTVTEVSGRIPASVVAGGNSYDYQSTTGEGNVSVTAANIPTNPATADVVNTYSASQPQPSTCNIDIDKTTVGGAEVAGATIAITNTSGTDLSGCTVTGDAQSSSISGNVITFVSGSNGTTSIVGLPDGDYVLEETIVPTVSGGSYTVATTIGFTIDGGVVVDSSVTGITDGNGYQPASGTANAVFVMFDNFTADPTEPTPSDTTPTDTTPTETTPTESSSEDTQPAVPQYGCLVISKTISGTALNELETITFVLTDTSCGATREVPALTLANVQSGLWGDAGNGNYYYIVEGLSAGVTYTVTESLDGHTSTYSLDAVNSITTGSAQIVANGTVYVNLTDAYVTGDAATTTETSSTDETTPSDETTETTAPEVSSVTLDGQPLSPDSYTVNPDGTITLNDAIRRSLGSGDHTIVITYVNGATRTQTVHVDGSDRDVAETGESSVNPVATVIMLSAMVMIFFSKKLRDEAEAEAEN